MKYEPSMHMRKYMVILPEIGIVPLSACVQGIFHVIHNFGQHAIHGIGSARKLSLVTISVFGMSNSRVTEVLAKKRFWSD